MNEAEINKKICKVHEVMINIMIINLLILLVVVFSVLYTTQFDACFIYKLQGKQCEFFKQIYTIGSGESKQVGGFTIEVVNAQPIRDGNLHFDIPKADPREVFILIKERICDESIGRFVYNTHSNGEQIVLDKVEMGITCNNLVIE